MKNRLLLTPLFIAVIIISLFSKITHTQGELGNYETQHVKYMVDTF
ncbi:hypothetical protein ACFLTP_10640 [Chloroflexota bacterium]